LAAKRTKLQTEVLADLQALPPERFVSIRLLEPVPHIFRDDAKAYLEWRHELARLLGVDPRAIAIVGSAAVGVSLSPRKNLAPFHDGSDVDVAVISWFHFETAWDWLRKLGASYYTLPASAQVSVKEHRERLVYWGTIATDKIVGHLPFASTWVRALGEVGKKTPPIPRSVNVRLYRDFEALRAYHVHGVGKLRTTSFAWGGTS